MTFHIFLILTNYSAKVNVPVDSWYLSCNTVLISPTIRAPISVTILIPSYPYFPTLVLTPARPYSNTSYNPYL